MARIWLDGTRLMIEANSIKEERLLKEAVEHGYIRKADWVNLEGLDVIFETKTVNIMKKKGGNRNG